MNVSATNGKRFAMFNNEGLNICLMNGYYDEQYPKQKEVKGPIFPEYDNIVLKKFTLSILGLKMRGYAQKKSV